VFEYRSTIIVPGGVAWLNRTLAGVLPGAQTVCLTNWSIASPAVVGGLTDVVVASLDMDGYGMCAWLRRVDNGTLAYVMTEYPFSCPADFSNATTAAFSYVDGQYQPSPLPTPSPTPTVSSSRRPTSGAPAVGLAGLPVGRSGGGAMSPDAGTVAAAAATAAVVVWSVMGGGAY
jgi:hypothetical protein